MKRISLLILSLLFLSTAFQSDKIMTSGWTLRILPNLFGAQILDVTFTDSLTGYFTTDHTNGTAFLYKTTNGGDNWVLKKTNRWEFTRIIFCDKNIGFSNSYDTLYKTTDAGENWTSIPLPDIFGEDMFVLNKDTLWLAMSLDLGGGLFRSTNGGLSWIKQNFPFQYFNPDKIYMVNKNLGFMSRDRSYEGRTTNGGFNWSTQIVLDSSFDNIGFADSLTGWKSFVNVKKTTDGGLTWFSQYLPKVVGSNFNRTGVGRFSILNKDTVFGVGGWYDDPNNVSRCIIYKTTNGGLNWGYQIPDTSFNIWQLRHIYFTDKNNGWAFRITTKCIRTTTGGSDTTFFTGIKLVPSIVPEKFSLGQNYPNPFNPATNIPFELKEPSHVTLKVFDARGREVKELVNGRWGTGKFIADFDASALTTGIYFYQIKVSGETTHQTFTETRKMMLLK